MKVLKIIFVLFQLAAITKAQDSTTYNLKQCIDIAIKNNLTLKLSEFQMEASNERLQQARAGNLPYLSAYANQGINSGKSINPYTNTFINQQILTGQYGLNGGVTLWNGFSNYNTMRQSSFAYRAGKSDWEQAKIDLTINVILAYLQVLSSEEQLLQANSQVLVSGEQAKRLAVLDNNKAISPSELYDTKGQLANDKLAFINAKANLNSSRISLAQLMNVNFEPNVRFEKVEVQENPALYTSTPDDLYAEALKTFPSVKSAEYRKMSAVKGLHSSRGQMFPSLSLNGSIGTNYSDAALNQRVTSISDGNTDQYVVINNTAIPVMAPQYSFSSEKISFGSQFKNNLNSYVGLSLQFTIFNSLNNKTRVGLSKIAKQQAEVQQKTVNTNLKSAIQLAHSDMTASYERLQVLQEQVKDYSASFKIATGKFEKGALSSVDYVISKNNFDRANMNLITARFDYILKVKILEYYKGKI